MAERMLITVWIIIFQVSLFFIVLFNYSLQKAPLHELSVMREGLWVYARKGCAACVGAYYSTKL